MSHARQKFLLALLAAAAFLPFLGARDIVTSHEARVVQTARAMADSGWPWAAKPVSVPVLHQIDPALTGGLLRLEPDTTVPPLRVNPWLVPVLNDQIRLQKPPLPYWSAALLFRLRGEWSEALARLIPALLGVLSTLLIFDLARRLIGRRAGLPAAFVWVSSYFVPDEFRKVMADPYLACFALLAVWGWVRGTRASVLLAYAGLGLAFLAKGPVVFIHVVTPLLLYRVLNRRRLPGSIVTHLFGLLVAVAIGLPWYLYIYKTIPNVIDVWHFESIGELTDNLNNARPWWFYIPNLFQISLPWTPVWVLAIALPFIRKSRIANRKSRLLPLAWYGLVVLFFSFVNLKKNAYLLPAMPAQALLTTQGLLFLIAALRRRGPKSAAAWLAAAQTLVALGFAAALPVLVYRAGVWLPVAVLFGLVPAAVAFFALGDLRRGRPRGWLTLTACACVLAVLVFFNLYVTPEENARRSPRPACKFITGVLGDDPQATVIPGKLPVEASVYLPMDLRVNPAATRVLYLLDDKSKTDAGAFAQRLPEYAVTDVRPMMVPGADRRYRWRLFVVSVGRKVMAGNPKDEISKFE